MSSPPVHHIDVRAFRYATEVPDRVIDALRVIYPSFDEPDEPTLERSVTEGHYGNQIEVYSLSLTRADEFRTVFEQLRRHGDLQVVLDELDERMTDECDLFLRFDKQHAYTDGRLDLGRGIEMRIRVEAYPAKREAAMENIHDYLETLLEEV